jgi:hypothetical protein
MRTIVRWLAAAVLALASTAASAAFHLWQITELYSNADGTVQFVELTALAGGQQFLNGHTLTSTNGVTTNTFNFPSDLPGDTSGKKMLIGTTGFAALGVVAPDYAVPNSFFFPAGGTINFASADVWNHPATPAPPLSRNRDGSTGTNSPTNFAGLSGTIPTAPASIGISPSPVTFNPASMNTTSPPNVVTIANNSASPVTVSTVAVSGDFAIPSHTCTSLDPGATCQAGIYFTPTGEGARMGTLTVTSNAPGSPHTASVSGSGERSLVIHYYRSILRRAPDTGGKNFWEGEKTRVSNLGANVNEVWYSMAQTFYFSPEYFAFNRDNTGYVTDLYNTFFNRAPDSGGLDFWVGNLNSGMPREVLLAEFMFSAEFRNFSQAIFGNPATRAEMNTVMDFYRGLLSRLPDSGGFNFWLGRFRAAQCNANPGPAIVAEVESISSAFTLSGEYTGRNRTTAQYVGDLYNAFLRRGGDLTGVQFWINQITSGARTREQVRVEFKNSPEFQAQVNALIQKGCNT